MLFAYVKLDGKEQLCCIDKIGKRAFPTEEFFKRDLKDLCIDSNKINKIPETMDDFIQNYDIRWTDDMALFFGGNPDLGISLNPQMDWSPLTGLEEIWSPLDSKKGRGLLD